VRGWEQKMDSSNFWDWNTEDEHRVSAVYRDTEDEAQQNAELPNAVGQSKIEQSNAKQTEIEINPAVQNTEIQKIEIQKIEAQNTEVQNTEAQNNTIQSSELQNETIEQTKDIPPEIVPENNFILVDDPQVPTQNTARQTQYEQTQYEQTQYEQTQYQQTRYQQNNFQQIIPIHNAQQDKGTGKRDANQNKNANYRSEFDLKDISENKVSAMAAYLMGPVGIIIALLIARDSAYTAFHVRQALKLTVCSVALEIIAAIFALFGMIPFVGMIFKLVLMIICAIWIYVLVLRLIAIAQVCDGEAREPAIIGKMNCFH